MPRAFCLIHANCQGQGLLTLLNATPAFARLFEARHCLNYMGQSLDQGLLNKTGLYLYQYLGSAWGDGSSESTLRRLPANCKCLQIPNLFFKGYWPFWSRTVRQPRKNAGQESVVHDSAKPGKTLCGKSDSPAGIDFTDDFLESLLARGLSPGEALGLACGKDVHRLWQAMADVEAIAMNSLAREEEKQKGCQISCASILRDNWREEQLFITVNHPSARLFFHVADSVLGLLGLGHLPESVRRGWVHPDGDFWLPIHPALGRILGLPFASHGRKYPVFATSLTHTEYTAAYLACRSNGVGDLLVFLRNLPASGMPKNMEIVA